ncbi:repetitive organellar protein-like [Mytilus edulis]|uniref:repetitive organellar protein-like n=1 Tax=Mytilus edulis TaxID=6550 RepID=UPI0039F0AE75
MASESQKAVHEARCVLEFKQQTYTVPNHLAGRVIGKNENVIKDVIDKSFVKKIETQNKEENAVVTFNIIGSKEAIQRAVLMLNNKLEEIECMNERIQGNAVIKKLFYHGRKEIPFKGENKEDRHQKQDKKGSRSKTPNKDRHKKQDKKGSRSKAPDEDCFVFFLKNKMLRRLDYVKKQKQKQRALLKLDKVNVKMEKKNQCQRKLSKRGLPNDLQLLIDEFVHSNSSFIENIMADYLNEEEEIYYRRTCVNFGSPRKPKEKRDICFEKCKEIEIKREDEQSWWLKPQPTKDTWEEWDSDEESGISTELEQFEKDETNARYNCLSDNLTNQLLSVNDEIETSVAYNVDDWW